MPWGEGGGFVCKTLHSNSPPPPPSPPKKTSWLLRCNHHATPICTFILVTPCTCTIGPLHDAVPKNPRLTSSKTHNTSIVNKYKYLPTSAELNQILQVITWKQFAEHRKPKHTCYEMVHSNCGIHASIEKDKEKFTKPDIKIKLSL